jgi:hypothetical protein
MTHHIRMEDAPDVLQIMLYILYSGLFGLVIGFLGGLITFFYPNMTAETRTLIAFLLIMLSSTVVLWGAGLLRISYFIMETLGRVIMMKRDRNGVPEL